MTVQELINRLKKYHPSTNIIIDNTNQGDIVNINKIYEDTVYQDSRKYSEIVIETTNKDNIPVNFSDLTVQ